jgi:D-glycero-beta-D-manno-heptose-7-phosphate kinase
MSGKTKIKQFSSIEEIFQAFCNLRVLIVGDVMIDSYLWGKVERISPEAPVPIVHVQKREMRLGGAANVALNVQSMGATPVICSVIGDDMDGDNFLSLLDKGKLPKEGIVRSSGRITTIKHRVISGGHHMLRVDQEIDSEINDKESKLLFERAKKLIPSCDVIIFEDYDKGVLNKSVIKDIIAFANKNNKPTVVDPKKRNFLFYKDASLFKPNRKELIEGLKLSSNLNDLPEILKAVRELKSTIKSKAILITLSEKGVFIEQNKEQHLIPAHIREISDVSGAGDTVISIAALCYALELAPKLLASLSNLGGGIVCEHVGVVPINKNALLKEARKLKLFEDVL